MSSANVQFSVATHIMAVLAERADENIHSGTLAESVNTSPTFVRKSLSKLVKAGLVNAVRGKHGYCKLARPASKISLAEILRASGTPAVFSVHSYPVLQTCPTSRHIRQVMSGLMPAAQAALEGELSHTSLQDLVEQIRRAEG